jgi:hypothetical protein
MSSYLEPLLLYCTHMLKRASNENYLLFTEDEDLDIPEREAGIANRRGRNAAKALAVGSDTNFAAMAAKFLNEIFNDDPKIQQQLKPIIAAIEAAAKKAPAKDNKGRRKLRVPLTKEQAKVLSRLFRQKLLEAMDKNERNLD